MNLGLHIIQYPSGKYGFVGSVPTELAYVSQTGNTVDSETIEREHRLPSSYRTIKTRSWTSYEDALTEAIKLGFTVTEKK